MTNPGRPAGTTRPPGPVRLCRRVLGVGAAVAAVAATAALAGCSSSGPDPLAGAGYVAADVPRAAVAAGSLPAATTTVDSLGLAVLRSLAAARPTENLVLSPTSIATALAMTRAGAAGSTATQLDAVLHSSDPATLAASMNALSLALAARNRTVARPDGSTAAVSWTQVTSLWAQQGLTLRAPFLDTLAADYGTGVHTVDYRSDPQAARDVVNAWVARQTDGRLPALLAPGSFDTATRLLLVDAVHLTAPWLTAFETTATRSGSFSPADGPTVQVPFMHTTADLGYATGPGWQAVDLPYAGDELSMVVVLPDAGTLAGFETSLTAQRLTAVFDALHSTPVALALPRWHTTSEVSLSRVLSDLGMPVAFTAAADFSGMTASEPLQIGTIVHQATITVDEAGTEAAAATAVAMRPTAVLADPVPVRVDRPFLFALRDRATGVVLFLGQVTTPGS